MVRLSFCLLVPLVFAAVAAPLQASSATSSSRTTPSFIKPRVPLSPTTPLDQIPVYSLSASDPGTCRALGAEIDRLYRYATTLPPTSERWAFQSRIHRLEKELHSLTKSYDGDAWTALRDAVRKEWIDIQATLAPAVENENAAAAAASTAKPAKSADAS